MASEQHSESRTGDLDLDEHVLLGWTWFRKHGHPRYWAAPLVGLSDPAFRILIRRHGAQMAHTEMVDAAGFAVSPPYREQFFLPKDSKYEILQPSETDRPLVLQLGGADIDMLDAAAVAAIEDGRCDAIELNCGCPQRCARKGGYGAFLLDASRRKHLLAIIARLRSRLAPTGVPLLVKMRVLETIDETVDLARQIQDAGTSLVTVHGRTRRQGGGAHTAGVGRLASWPHIRAIKEALSIPVIANGNIPDAAAIASCLAATQCDGVMSGCGLLRNPALFGSQSLSDLTGTLDSLSVHVDSHTTLCTGTPHGQEVSSTVMESQLHADWDAAGALVMEYLALAEVCSAHWTSVSKHLLWMLTHRGLKKREPALHDAIVGLRYTSDTAAATLGALQAMTARVWEL